MPRRHRQAGFTLLEVMVALVVVALALTAVAASMSQMLDAAETMRERTFASWIALNKIAEMRLANVIPKVAETSGEVDYAGTTWGWRAVVSETGVENLFRLDVTITHAGSDNAIRTETGFIGEPVIPGQSNRIWNSTPVYSGETR